jgi:hypothetical protein
VPNGASHDLAEKAFEDRLSTYKYNAAYISAAKKVCYDQLGISP